MYEVYCELCRCKKFIIYGTKTGMERNWSVFQSHLNKFYGFMDRNSGILKNKKIFQIGEDIEDVDLIIIASEFWKEIYEELKNKYSNVRFVSPYGQVSLMGKIGKHTVGVNSETIENPYLIKSIGSFCSINYRAKVGTLGNHNMGITTYILGTLTNKHVVMPDFESIEIGHDVWVGTNAIILPNVKIGTGAIVAAGAVVTKDVPEYSIVAGIPARVIKYRFKQKEIEKLLKIKWWEWSDEKIFDNQRDLENPAEFFLNIDKW